MKRYFTLLLLFAFVFNYTHAQIAIEKEATIKTEVQEAPLQLENSLLWEITGKNLEKPSYLFGTIHMIGKEDFLLTDLTQSSFKNTERVTFEINMADMTDMMSQFSMMMKAFMDNGTTLKDLLEEEDYKLVTDYFSKMGLPMMFLERIKPMFLSAMTSTDMSPQAMQSGEIVSYEMELMKIAEEQEKEVGGLETAEFQMSMFDSIPYAAQAEMLVEGIKNGNDAANDQFAEMVKMYKAQDINGMQKIMGEDEGIGEYEDLLLVNRNKNWIPIMATMMTEKPTFFAVGAGHLGGENGVINLLLEEGYSVKAIGAVE